MSVLSKIKVYATHPHPCSYQQDREATTLFIDPSARIDAIAYRDLTEIGFRRSGAHYYRPHCKSCNDCIPARIPVDLFHASRRQKRVQNKNSDLEINDVASIDGEEYYQLYARYIEGRHVNGDMYPPTREQYQQFLVRDASFCQFTEFRLDGELICVSVRDDLQDSYSAIYTFFDPEHSQRGLGNLAILWLVELCKQQNRHYLYLGYWIRQCRKMSYKIEYRPIELLLNGRWQRLR